MDMDYEPTTLSLDDVQRLDDRNRADYMAFRRMFESDGWKLLQAWIVEQQRQQMNQQLVAKNWDIVLQTRGAFAAYETVRTIEQATEMIYLQIAQRDNESEDESA